MKESAPYDVPRLAAEMKALGLDRVLLNAFEGLSAADCAALAKLGYLVANPYMKFEQFYVPSEPPVVALHGLYAEIANDAMRGILTETERQSPDQLQLCFCYMMDLLGIMTEKMPREYFHQTPGQK